MSRISRTESVGDSLCPVCHEQSEIYAIGPCDHPICYRCSTRMRVLCNQMYCPICRGDLPQILFLTTKRKYDEVDRRDCIPNRKYKILLEDESVEDAYEALLEHRCRICDRGPLFDSFPALQNHMRRVHTLFACDLCIHHLKIFPFERKFYSRKDLATHRRSGDPDNRSYRGHPLCQFCDERYMDKDELLRHLRKSHYFCHFCDAINSNEYFNDYSNLKEHFRAEHFLCEEDQCGSPDTRFTNAFSAEIDFKAHKATEHIGNKSKAEAKGLRTLDVNFQMAPRRRGRDASIISPEDFEECHVYNKNPGERRQRRYESHTGADSQTPPPERITAPTRPPDLDDFPTLGTVSLASTFTANQKVPVEKVEEFPSLPVQKQPRSTVITASSVSDVALPVKSAKFTNGHNLGNGKSSNNFCNIAAAMTSTEVSRPCAQSRPSEISHPVTTCAVTKSMWTASKLTSSDDFPTLGSDKSTKTVTNGPNNIYLGAWSKKQKESNSFQKPNSAKSSRQSLSSDNKTSSLTSQRQAFCDDGEFPVLGGGNGLASQPVTWVQKSVNPNKHRNNKSPTSDMTKLSVSKSNPEGFLSDSGPEWKTEESKSKKKKQKQKEKTKNMKALSETNSLSLSSIASKISSTTVISESKPTVTKSPDKNEQNSMLNSVSENAVNEVTSSQCETHVPSTELASLPDQESSTENWETVKTKSKAFKEDDFPSLQALTNKSAPPPGFHKPTKVAPPPPGLNKPVMAWARTPPGLSSAGELSFVPPSLGGTEVSIPMSVKLNMYPYEQLADAVERNRALVKLIREILDPKDGGFDQFRLLSVDFRSSQMNAQQYHKKCQDLLGQEKFLEVLPEMIALLPDILKQHELAQAHKQDVLGICAPLRLQSCPTCCQLLQQDDLTAHCTAHNNLTSNIASAGFSASTLPVKT